MNFCEDLNTTCIVNLEDENENDNILLGFRDTKDLLQAVYFLEAMRFLASHPSIDFTDEDWKWVKSEVVSLASLKLKV